MNSLLKAAGMLAIATVAQAQVPGAAAKAAAQHAVAATNAHIAAEQAVEAPQPAAKGAGQAPAKSPAKAVERPVSGKSDLVVDTAGTTPVIMRESYDYSREGRRDPFVSLLTTNELRPTMSDLRLTGILFDQGGHSVATLRDLATNASYRVATGATLGRMRVSAIRLKTVVFTIDEFGTTRQDSLYLGDSTKVRGK
jgi:hypothetical protein